MANNKAHANWFHTWIERWIPVEIRVFLRLLYIVVLLALAGPLIYYGLSAYQYHQTAHAIAAADDDIDADRLMYRAATWQDAVQGWLDLVDQGVAAGQTGMPPQSDDSGNGSPPDRSSQVTRADLAAAFQRALDGQGKVLGAASEEEDGADKENRAAQVLASELVRFDSLGLPAWFFGLPCLFEVYARPSMLAVLPEWALTLLVTLLAGLLGSMVFVLMATLRGLLDDWSTKEKTPDRRRRQRPVSWLILRPVFGVVTALSAYVALQSGMLIIDGTGLEEAQPLNAYVTAVVGLIAGLLSWHVIDMIEGLGERWLRRQRALWAYGLKNRLKAWRSEPSDATDTAADQPPKDDQQNAETKKTALEDKIPTFATQLRIHPDIMRDWVYLRVPVPPTDTTRIAGELNADPDTIFLPVAPWQRGAPRADGDTCTGTTNDGDRKGG